MNIIKLLTSIFFILNSLAAEIYPLSQKPFIDTIVSTDQFKRGTYLIIVAEARLEDQLSVAPAIDFPYFKKTQGYDVEIWNYENIEMPPKALAPEETTLATQTIDSADRDDSTYYHFFYTLLFKKFHQTMTQ